MAAPTKGPVAARTIRSVLAAASLAVAVLAIAATTTLPAAAYPPPDSDPPPDRPPRTPTTTTPPTTTPRVLDSLAVNTDSVVATATIHYNGAPGIVTVDWGDGANSSRDPNAINDSPRPTPNPDPPGVITFQHAYTPPSNGRSFGAEITARIGAESQTAGVLVTPRYRVTQYLASLTPLDPCDSAIEQYTEWRVVRTGASLAERTWRFDLAEPSAWVGDYPGSTYWLPDSAVIFEGTVDQAGSIDYQVTELDPVFDQFGGTRRIDLDPVLGSRSVTLHYPDFLNWPVEGCDAEIRADIGVTLLKPGLGGGPVAGQ